jgi:lipoate-protein ligase A
MSIKILQLENTPIEEQLKIEEDLLRNDPHPYVIIGTNLPTAIVMGSSQKKEDVIDLKKAYEQKIPIIQRFSAGGCVLLDKDSIVVSFILNKKNVGVDLFPQTLMKWSIDFYQKAHLLPDLDLQGNDYTLKDRKIGGNAQYIKRDRFVHHTSFLWDFCPEKMEVLLHPPKEPCYRNKRPHQEFLTTIKPHLSKEGFIESIKNRSIKVFR